MFQPRSVPLSTSHQIPLNSKPQSHQNNECYMRTRPCWSCLPAPVTAIKSRLEWTKTCLESNILIDDNVSVVISPILPLNDVFRGNDDDATAVWSHFVQIGLTTVTAAQQTAR